MDGRARLDPHPFPLAGHRDCPRAGDGAGGAAAARRAHPLRAGCFALAADADRACGDGMAAGGSERAGVAVLRARAGGCRCAGLTGAARLSPSHASKGDSPLVEARRSERSTIATTSSSGGRERLDPSALMPWIVAAWTLGVLICSVRLAGGWWQARRLATIGTRPVVGTMGPREGRAGGAPRALCARCGCSNRAASPCPSSSAGSSRRCWCRRPCSAECTRRSSKRCSHTSWRTSVVTTTS